MNGSPCKPPSLLAVQDYISKCILILHNFVVLVKIRHTCAADNGARTWGPSQPPGSGWDDDTPAQPLEPTPSRNAGRGSTDSARGRGNSNRGRGFAPVRPEPARNNAEEQTNRQADVAFAMPGATWDDDVPVPSSQVCDTFVPVAKHSHSGSVEDTG